MLVRRWCWPGDQDVQYDPAAALERARRLLPNVRTELIAGAGHGLPLELPGRFARLVKAFLQESETE
ncbi:hypothetical protein J31TS4_10280 [Paenibacillus sp. J31TS4]|uniref:alpha/beta fold hydrolase n=1 Tax=Paenibacillus sp. J31TS4 TaxID=2807195 RepID=UPI001B063730|nr:alpha/beta hydrolase [Paenibacillus sp. J31TS4]GIP37748.1 hypothetical protein J31TS4_10280 [Paenibacillus sp. J31TS4]